MREGGLFACTLHKRRRRRVEAEEREEEEEKAGLTLDITQNTGLTKQTSMAFERKRRRRRGGGTDEGEE